MKYSKRKYVLEISLAEGKKGVVQYSITLTHYAWSPYVTRSSAGTSLSSRGSEQWALSFGQVQ